MLYGDAVRPGRNGRLREFRHPDPLTVAAFWDRGVCQQAILYARRLFQQHGGFDESLRIAGDWDFDLRVLMAGGTSRHVGFPLVRYQGNGISVREKDTALAEADQVLRRRLPEAVYRDYRELVRLRKDVRRLDVMRRCGFLRNVWIAAQWQWQNIKAAVRNAGRGEET